MMDLRSFNWRLDFDGIIALEAWNLTRFMELRKNQIKKMKIEKEKWKKLLKMKIERETDLKAIYDCDWLNRQLLSTEYLTGWSHYFCTKEI